MFKKSGDFSWITVWNFRPLYLRSSVTPVPPFPLPLIVSNSLNCSMVLGGRTSDASRASFSRIWRMVKSCVGLSKYSSWCLKSCSNPQDQNLILVIRNSCSYREAEWPKALWRYAQSLRVKWWVQGDVIPIMKGHYREGGFMDESRRRMPWLNLESDYELDLAFVWATWTNKWSDDSVDLECYFGTGRRVKENSGLPCVIGPDLYGQT